MRAVSISELELDRCGRSSAKAMDNTSGERGRTYRARGQISRGHRRIQRGNYREYCRRMKMRDANRASTVRDTCDGALRKFRPGGDSMKMRRGERLPEHQHYRRHECDIAQEGFIAMLRCPVH